MADIIVATGEAGLTLEAFLQQRILAAPPSYLRKLLSSGRICCGNDPVRKDRILTAGDIIHLPDSRRLLDLLNQTEKMSVRILYESDQLLLVNKPAGLATHAGQGHEEDNLTARVAGLLRHRGEHFMVAPVQRLDRDTSGVVLFGKGKKNCSVLGTMMMTTAVTKIYLALVAGHVSTDGTLIGEIAAKGKMKTAITHYRVLTATDKASLLQIELGTGRQHQIRRQFAQIGHPLYGDRRFGGPRCTGLARLFLHCCRIAFNDPFTNETLSVMSQLPEELQAYLDKTGHAGYAPVVQ